MSSRPAVEEMDPAVLRAVIREKVHHTVELPLHRALFGGGQLRADAGAQARRLLAIWQARGLPANLGDLRWAERLLAAVDDTRAGRKPELQAPYPRPLPPEQLQAVETLMRTRRSIRWWKPDPVPRDLVLRIIDAGLWAPHACNLQTLRFLIMEDAKSHALFQMKEFHGAPVYITVCQDTRPYAHFAATVPHYNQYLDCGAAVQSMCLMSHALGLGAVWGTFHPKEVQNIVAHYDLEPHVGVVTYLAVGWPAGNPIAPARLTPEEAIIAG